MADEKRLMYVDDFKKNMCSYCNLYLSEEPCEPNECWVCDVIAQTDTVDAVEVVHGRWLFDSNTERCFCSACNEEALYTSKDDPIFDYDWEENLRYSHTETILEEHLTNYCPNCGAKMDGDGNA